MFGINWSDSQTLWLNVINASLGVVTLICFAVIGYGIWQDVRVKMRKRAEQSAMNRVVGDLVGSLDTHTFHMPELGLTMADGGEPEPAKSKTAKTPTKPSPQGK
jgi:hypothetical protein